MKNQNPKKYALANIVSNKLSNEVKIDKSKLNQVVNVVITTSGE